MTSRKYLITVDEEEGCWLDKHPEYNKSAIFKILVRSLMNRTAPLITEEDVSYTIREVKK